MDNTQQTMPKMPKSKYRRFAYAQSVAPGRERTLPEKISRRIGTGLLCSQSLLESNPRIVGDFLSNDSMFPAVRWWP